MSDQLEAHDSPRPPTVDVPHPESIKPSPKDLAAIQLSTRLTELGYEVPPFQVESWLLNQYFNYLRTEINTNTQHIARDQPSRHFSSDHLQPLEHLSTKFQLAEKSVQELLSDPHNPEGTDQLPLHTWLSLRATSLTRRYNAYRETSQSNDKSEIDGLLDSIKNKIADHTLEDVHTKDSADTSPKKKIAQAIEIAGQQHSLIRLYHTLTDVWSASTDLEADFLENARGFCANLPFHIDAAVQNLAYSESQSVDPARQRVGRETLFFLSLNTTVNTLDNYSWYNFPDPQELVAQAYTDTIEYMASGSTSLTFRTALALHLPHRITSTISRLEGIPQTVIEQPDFVATYILIQDIRSSGWLDRQIEEAQLLTELQSLGLSQDSAEAYLQEQFAIEPEAFAHLLTEDHENHEVYTQIIAAIDRLPLKWQAALKYRLVQHKNDDHRTVEAGAREVGISLTAYSEAMRSGMRALRRECEGLITA